MQIACDVVLTNTKYKLYFTKQKYYSNYPAESIQTLPEYIGCLKKSIGV